MKKTFIFVAVLFLAFTGSLFADRAQIDGVIQAYEAIVVEAEQVAEMQFIASADFSALQEKAAAAIAPIEAIAGERAWSIPDALNLAELNARFNLAMTKIAQTLLKH